ncbi:type I addiction module toxin, SymE family [Chitinophaga oryziterrae]|uniref:Type I addiction module toxin, SymE family n=1 Tax=Chitinophaga oryziterrae TaxID=1031224 RepID=A0A6N8JIX4_9BACT|nr:SymE family type I addiction module toxin [Chitinophaga oryziterrae]MVT44339.1 type I addiction module toxin, SymE family [Chitinophaga oryziterrae]
MEKKRIRLAKVHGRSQEVQNIYGDDRSGYRAVPWLRMGGLWMEKLGFKVGDPIEVRVGHGKLVIKKITGRGDHKH